MFGGGVNLWCTNGPLYCVGGCTHDLGQMECNFWVIERHPTVPPQNHWKSRLTDTTVQ